MRLLTLIVLLPLCGAAAAEELTRPVERITISPGASGSISSESRQQRYDVYGGYPVPEQYGRQIEYRGTQQVQPSGGLRQSIEYPDGRVIEITPGQGSQHYQGYDH